MSSLLNTPLLFLDCQTTGTSPLRGHLLEVAWKISTVEEFFKGVTQSEASYLVALPEGKTVPTRVQQITGISDSHLIDAPAGEVVWESLLKALPLCEWAVIHYARFETAFLAQVSGEARWQHPTLCLYQLARKTLPELASWTLRALSGYFGTPLPELQRASSHAEATRRVWAHLAVRLSDSGVDDWEKLQAWLTTKRPTARPPRTYLLSREERLMLPDAPGIYRMHACDGSVLYVGKATSLKSRVSTYFKQRGLRGRLADMATQVTSISVVPTATPVDAALLENEEIKRLDPPYNTSLKSRARRLVYLSPDLSKQSYEPSEDFPYGPFLSARAFDDFNEFMGMLKAGAADPELLKQVCGDDTLENAESLPATFWIRLGYRFFRDERRGIDFPELPEEASELEQMTDAIRRVLRRVARALHRSRELCLWSEVSVAWPMNDTEWRWIVVDRGKIMSQGSLTEREEIPPPTGWSRVRRERQRRFDLVSYDAVRVLSGEMTRLKNRGIPVRLRFSPFRESRLKKSISEAETAENGE